MAESAAETHEQNQTAKNVNCSLCVFGLTYSMHKVGASSHTADVADMHLRCDPVVERLADS